MHTLRLTVLVTGLGLCFSTLASAQALTTYGTPTAGTGGKKPFLWALSTPRSGNKDYGLSLDNGKAGALAVAFFSPNQAKTTFGGVNIWIDFAASLQLPFITLDKNGKGVWKIPLPDLSAVLGLRGYHQAFIADGGGAPAGFAATQGLQNEVARHGLLIGSRNTGQTNAPQIAINLDTGGLRVFSAPNLKRGNIPSLYPKNATHVFTGSSSTNKVFLFDARVFPPKFVSEFSSTFNPWCVTCNPDGLRTYVVNQGLRNTKPTVEVFWATPGSTNFGKPFPGGPIPLNGVLDAMQLRFTSDGNTGVLITTGFSGGGAQVRKFDTKVGSKTYHQQTGTLSMAPNILWELSRIDDDRFAAASFGITTEVQLNVIDIRTMKVTQTFGPKGLGSTPGGLAVDPRGRYLYCGKTPSSFFKSLAGIARAHLDKTDPNFGKVTHITAGIQSSWRVYDVEVSDAGDRLYAVAGKGSASSFVGDLIEYDTANTSKVRRRWSLNKLGSLNYILVR